MISGLDDEVKKEPITWDPGGSFGRALYSASHPCNSLCTESIQRPGQSEQQNRSVRTLSRSHAELAKGQLTRMSEAVTGNDRNQHTPPITASADHARQQQAQIQDKPCLPGLLCERSELRLSLLPADRLSWCCASH